MKDTVIFPLCVLGTFVKTKMGINTWIYLCAVCSAWLDHLSFYTSTMRFSLLWLCDMAWRQVQSLRFCSFLLRMNLNIWNLSCFHRIFRIFFFYWCDDVLGVMIVIALMYFCFFFSLYHQLSYELRVKKSFTSLAKFVCKYSFMITVEEIFNLLFSILEISLWADFVSSNCAWTVY